MLDGTYIAPASATTGTKYFPAARKYDDAAKELAKQQDITQLYRDHVNTWKVRQEKNRLTSPSYGSLQIYI